MHDPPHPGGVVRRQCLEPLGLTRQALSERVNERTGVSVEQYVAT